MIPALTQKIRIQLPCNSGQLIVCYLQLPCDTTLVAYDGVGRIQSSAALRSAVLRSAVLRSAAAGFGCLRLFPQPVGTSARLVTPVSAHRSRLGLWQRCAGIYCGRFPL